MQRSVASILLPTLAAAVFVFQLIASSAPSVAQSSSLPTDLGHSDWSEIDANCRTAAVRARIDDLETDAKRAKEAIATLDYEIRKAQGDLAQARVDKVLNLKGSALMGDIFAARDLLVRWRVYLSSTTTLLDYYRGLPPCGGWDTSGARLPEPPPHGPIPKAPPIPPAIPVADLPLPPCRNARGDKQLQDYKNRMTELVRLRDELTRSYIDQIWKAGFPTPAVRDAAQTRAAEAAEADLAELRPVLDEIDQIQRWMSKYGRLSVCTGGVNCPPVKDGPTGDGRPRGQGGGGEPRSAWLGGGASVLAGVGVDPCPPPGRPGREEEDGD